MNGQDGRCTAAYESKAFPYFTINVYRRDLTLGNHGGILAFLERAKIVKKYRGLLDLLEVVVTSDFEFLCDNQDSCDALRAWLDLAFENEMLERECPTKQKWECLPMRFLPYD